MTVLKINLAKAVAVVALAAPMLDVPTTHAVGPGALLLASISDDGVKGNEDAWVQAISTDGNIVVFYSYASNLVSGDDDFFEYDVFAKNMTTGDIQSVATTADGEPGNGHSTGASVSADGTIVAFASDSTNLVPADTDSFGDIYLKNMVTGEITLASTSDDGVKGNDDSNSPSLSADGRIVAFRSLASNLDPLDPSSPVDIYVKNLDTGDLALASVTSDGVKGNGTSDYPSLSGDGAVVAFTSSATNFFPQPTSTAEANIYAKNLRTGDLSLVSSNEAGHRGNAYSYGASTSADGTAVAFTSLADNLDPADRSHNKDVYVKQLASGDVFLASTSSRGQHRIGDSTAASISGDGNVVGFGSNAAHLNRADGDRLFDLFTKNVMTGRVALVSVSATGVKSNGSDRGPYLSADASTASFSSTATNLVFNDTDDLVDAYVKTLARRS